MGIERVRPPGWPEAVSLLTTTRQGGVSEAPWDSLNLAMHVGDCSRSVAENRALLQGELPGDARIQWLQQVHGTNVVVAGRDDAPRADASWTAEAGVACAVLTADCLPVLFAACDGSLVAAAHAGWRGLCAGVLEATLAALPVPADRVLAWLGPCIGPRNFEVGPEVRSAFVTEKGAAAATFFRAAGEGSDRFLCDLQGLASHCLVAAGIAAVTASDHCTVSDQERFFSYRRDGDTGRMATLILRQ